MYRRTLDLKQHNRQEGSLSFDVDFWKSMWELAAKSHLTIYGCRTATGAGMRGREKGCEHALTVGTNRIVG